MARREAARLTPPAPVSPEVRARSVELAAIADEIQHRYGFDSWADAPTEALVEQEQRDAEVYARYRNPVTASS